MQVPYAYNAKRLSTCHSTAHSSVLYISEANNKALRRLVFPSYREGEFNVKAYESEGFCHNNTNLWLGTRVGLIGSDSNQGTRHSETGSAECILWQTCPHHSTRQQEA